MTLTQLEYIVSLDTHRHFVLASEKCFVTQPTLSMQIQKLEEELGVKIFDNVRQALNWCDVANILRIQHERVEGDIAYFPSQREYAKHFGINKELLNSINKEIVVMHPGPINRGVEVTSDIVDSDQSIILDQVENGVAIRMAVLYLLAGKKM